MTTGTCSRWANSSAICEAISPAPTTPTFVTGRASDLSGTPTGRLARFCTRSNEYRPERRLLGHQQVGQRLVLGRKGFVRGRSLGQFDEVQRPAAEPGGSAGLGRHEGTALGHRGVPCLAAIHLGTLTTTSPLSTPAAHSSDCSR